MKICIYGAGAIGGWVGGLLARAGADVTLIARGPHLAAMREKGLKVVSETESFTTRPACTDDPAEAGPQDVVIVTLKAPSVPAQVPRMAPLLGPDTAVVTAANGVPWWYFHGVEGPWRDRRLETVDPGNVQWDGIGPHRAIGAVLWPACEIEAPGVILHRSGDRLPLGEPDGSRSERVTALSKLLIAAGIKAPVRPNIRNEIWVKLWGNLSFNPISALTTATLAQMAEDPDTRAVVTNMMAEARAIGEKLDVRFPMSIEDRIESARKVGAHKTSMLQDLETGRQMEIDAIVGAVAELGRIVGVPTPTIDTVLGLVRQRARIAGCYGD
ncbi:2-dehydropantoate 2-reductase [Marinibaculum pumilum]|uniref:2-dehydropantoate 2-reductase n=1 Tax=Marinibaculum pumilum TaxID=1766165 RepID=A0ABV7L679_9PROT